MTREKADQENCDLSLETIEDRVRGQAFDQADDLAPIFGIFVRVKIDNLRGVRPEEKILEKKGRAGYGDGESCGREHKNQADD